MTIGLAQTHSILQARQRCVPFDRDLHKSRDRNRAARAGLARGRLTARGILAWVAFALSPATAAAEEGTTAESAMAAYQAGVQRALKPECRERSLTDEIVVCGSRDSGSRFRIPIPAEVEPGARISDEPPSAVELLDLGVERCSTVGRNPTCPSINWLGVGFLVAKAVVKAVQDSE
jgi:hypothetical protein